MKYLFNKIFFPDFLSKIDKKLIQKYPNIWITRIHYIVYYSLIVNILSSLILLQSDIKFCHITKFYYFNILFLVELMFVIYWIYLQTLHNNEKNYGKTNNSNSISIVLLYSFCLFLIVSPTILSAKIFKEKIRYDLHCHGIYESDIRSGYKKDNYPKYEICKNGSDDYEYSEENILRELKYHFCDGYYRDDVIILFYVLHLGTISLSFLLFIFKLVNWRNYIFSLLTMFGLLILIIVLTALLFPNKNNYKLIDFSIITFLLFLFIFIKVFFIRYKKSYSLISSVLLIVFSISIPIVTFITCLIIEDHDENILSYFLIATLSYYPFLPFIKKRFVLLLSLPKV